MVNENRFTLNVLHPLFPPIGGYNSLIFNPFFVFSNFCVTMSTVPPPKSHIIKFPSNFSSP